MTELDAFLDRCEAFAARAGLTLSTVSTKLFNDGSRLKNLRAGKDVGSRRLSRAAAALDDLEKQQSEKAV